ncbi:MAG: hypothetical protein M2R45_03129 [Verrucomicrobia subdivision 3 bacterium]|nr:hypothetical protein [Limisphaerales bacterium]MCS1413197.1 hypothetical protein [Limisphaerales bacterium]
MPNAERIQLIVDYLEVQVLESQRQMAQAEPEFKDT